MLAPGCSLCVCIRRIMILAAQCRNTIQRSTCHETSLALHDKQVFPAHLCIKPFIQMSTHKSDVKVMRCPFSFPWLSLAWTLLLIVLPSGLDPGHPSELRNGLLHAPGGKSIRFIMIIRGSSSSYNWGYEHGLWRPAGAAPAYLAPLAPLAPACWHWLAL
jgi:hypothetical protein